MVMIPNEPSTRGHVDLSFLVSLECNLRCPFCMYDCGPERAKEPRLNLAKVYFFLKDIRYSGLLHKVATFGMYGGEPALHLDDYATIASHLPPGPHRFTITNGTWSHDPTKTVRFIKWAENYNIRIYVSGTAEHRKHQDRMVLEGLAREGLVILKDADPEFIPMGRLAKENWTCRYRCHWDQRSRRLGVLPDGSVMLQSCDGVYPIIGHISEGFAALYKKSQQPPPCPRLQGTAYETPDRPVPPETVPLQAR